MKLLQIFMPRGRPLYQDEFSYYKNVFSSDNKEIQILKVCIVGPCLRSVGKDFFLRVHNIQGRRLSFHSATVTRRVFFKHKVPQKDIAVSLVEQNEKCLTGIP